MGSRKQKLTPTGVLGLSKAASEGTSVHETVGRVTSTRGFSDHKLVERYSIRADLEDGALGPGRRRSPEEVVTGGVLASALCKDMSLGWSRRAGVVACAYGCRTGYCTSQ